MSGSLEARVARLESELAVVKAQLAGKSDKGASADLPTVDIDDARYGDPTVRKDPPRWKGKSFAGRHYSECTPEYLRQLAGFKRWCAGKEKAEGKDKYAGYSMMDAAKALAWAARLETRPAAPVAGYDVEGDGDADAFQSSFDDGEIPF